MSVLCAEQPKKEGRPPPADGLPGGYFWKDELLRIGDYIAYNGNYTQSHAEAEFDGLTAGFETIQLRP